MRSLIQNYFDGLMDNWSNVNDIEKKSLKKQMITFIVALELSHNNIEADMCKKKIEQLK
jgi:hypothetical protein